MTTTSTYTAVYYGDENTDTFNVTLSSPSKSTVANMIYSPQYIYSNIPYYYNVSSSNPGVISTGTDLSSSSTGQINIEYILYSSSSAPYAYYLSTQLNINSTEGIYNIVGLQAEDLTTSYVYIQGFKVNNCFLTAEDPSVNFTFSTAKTTSTTAPSSNDFVSYNVNITTNLDYIWVDCAEQTGEILDLTNNTTYTTTYSFSYASSSTTPQITIEIFTQYNGSRLVPTKIKYTNNNNTTDKKMIISPIAFLCDMFYGISYDSYNNQSGVNPTGNNVAHSIENCIIIQQMLAPLYSQYLS